MVGRNSWFVILGLGFAACGDGLAPSDYPGEPLMSLNGTVTSTQSALTQDLVPALVLRESPFLPVKNVKQHFLQGEVEGEFPSEFTLRVYDAPPVEATLALIEGEPAFGVGLLTAVQDEHPTWLQQSEHDAVPGETDGHFELCSPDTCITGDYTQCADGPQDASAPWPCGQALPAELPWSSHGYAHEHAILYLAQATAEGSVVSSFFGDGGALAAGYHVLERHAEVFESDRDCYVRASARIADEQASVGGNPILIPGDTAAFEAAREKAEIQMRVLVEEQCEPAMRVVADTISAPVQLQFTDEPSPLSFY